MLNEIVYIRKVYNFLWIYNAIPVHPSVRRSANIYISLNQIELQFSFDYKFSQVTKVFDLKLIDETKTLAYEGAKRSLQ